MTKTKKYGGKDDRKGTTDLGRTIITSKDEEPKSARANQRLYQLYKFCLDLKPEEISYLITVRRNDIKYSDCQEDIKRLRTEILLLEDCYRITCRKNKGEKEKNESIDK